MLIACRATTGCRGSGASLGGPTIDSWPAVPTNPGWEWYRPPAADLTQLRDTDPDAYAHVVAGGLLLRPYRSV
jgi:hypothetical protein